MSIGQGWYEDHSAAVPDDYEPVRELAVGLLKNRLDEIFKKIAENPDRFRMAPKGRKGW